MNHSPCTLPRNARLNSRFFRCDPRSTGNKLRPRPIALAASILSNQILVLKVLESFLQSLLVAYPPFRTIVNFTEQTNPQTLVCANIIIVFSTTYIIDEYSSSNLFGSISLGRHRFLRIVHPGYKIENPPLQKLQGMVYIHTTSSSSGPSPNVQGKYNFLTGSLHASGRYQSSPAVNKCGFSLAHALQ